MFLGVVSVCGSVPAGVLDWQLAGREWGAWACVLARWGQEQQNWGRGERLMGEESWPIFASGSILLSLCCPKFSGSWGWGYGQGDLAGWSLPVLSLALSTLAGSQGLQAWGLLSCSFWCPKIVCSQLRLGFEGCVLLSNNVVFIIGKVFFSVLYDGNCRNK